LGFWFHKEELANAWSGENTIYHLRLEMSKKGAHSFEYLLVFLSEDAVSKISNSVKKLDVFAQLLIKLEYLFTFRVLEKFSKFSVTTIFS
jgi:hypothetical protein